jgi:putative selenate reductase
MAELVPIPLPVLITRLVRELEVKKAVYHLPRWRFFRDARGRDLGIDIHGRRAATPFGPAAGPHTQLAQNIVLAWLAGARVIELKTVQILDDLDIARPCIDMETVGYNIEWSQELSLEQSLTEYAKAAMLIAIARAEGLAGDDVRLADTVFDMSVGYDLAGIRSAKVRAFLDGMMDASAVIDRLRAEIPDTYARYRDLAFPTRLSGTVTLSTFHGCPPDEIERIALHLMAEVGLDVVVKLNPTLLGAADLTHLLHDRLGYTELRVPPATFATDATWDQVTGIVARLGDAADRLGRGFGVKFTNTLLVENHRAFFPNGVKEMYLSGPPLHVLAVELVRRFRDRFGDRFPISFSAGVDAENFADTAALGLKPVSVCSDLLKGAGYAKGGDYLAALLDRMAAVDAPDLDVYALRAFGQGEAALAGLDLPPEAAAACRAALAGGDPRRAAGAVFPAWVSAATILNTRVYADRVAADPRYGRAATAEPPRRTGVVLAALDCEMCGRCVTVCPNDAVFRYDLAAAEIAAGTLSPEMVATPAAGIAVPRRQQIGIIADVCNNCGNCQVACPEAGSPSAVKPNFFAGEDGWRQMAERDGLLVEATGHGLVVSARERGEVYRVGTREDGTIAYAGPGFALRRDAAGAWSGVATRAVDLGRAERILALAGAVTAPGAVNYVSAGIGRRMSDG